MNISKITGLRCGSRDRVRELVRIRDNHTCQCCGKKWKSGMRRFDVHHLDEKEEGKQHVAISYDKENMDKLITYCHKCHLNLDHLIQKFKIVNTQAQKGLTERNEKIHQEYTQGKTLMVKLAKKYAVTYQRIQQIIAREKIKKSL